MPWGPPAEQRPQAMHDSGQTCMYALMPSRSAWSSSASRRASYQKPGITMHAHYMFLTAGRQSVAGTFWHELSNCPFPPPSPPHRVQTCSRVLTAVAGTQCTPAHGGGGHTPACSPKAGSPAMQLTALACRTLNLKPKPHLVQSRSWFPTRWHSTWKASPSPSTSSSTEATSCRPW